MQVVCPIFCGRGLCLAFEMSCESRRVISTSVGSFEWHATFDFESEAILAWLEKAAGFFGQLKLKWASFFSFFQGWKSQINCEIGSLCYGHDFLFVMLSSAAGRWPSFA